MIGFQITEKMEGYHRFMSDPFEKQRHMEFSANWGTADIASWLDPDNGLFGINLLNGTVTIEGLCENAAMSGTLLLKYLDNNSIVYLFSFIVDNKDVYTYVGEKVNIKLWNLLTSHTTCHGILLDKNNKVVSTSTTFFKLKNLFSLLKSLKVFKTF